MFDISANSMVRRPVRRVEQCAQSRESRYVTSHVAGGGYALAVNLEECLGCGVSGWGWEDDGWGAANKNGVLLRFPQNSDRDPQGILIQTREDGVSIDQIVLSSETYLTQRPGAAKNDTTILLSTDPPR